MSDTLQTVGGILVLVCAAGILSTGLWIHLDAVLHDRKRKPHKKGRR